MSKEKVINYLENFLLIIFSIFLIFAPYYKQLGKRCFALIVPIWLLINIFKYKQKFFLGLIPKNQLNKYLLFFGFVCFLSTIFSLNPYHSQGIFFDRYFVYLFFFWIAAALTYSARRNLYILICVLLFSSFIFSLGGTWDYYYYRYLGRNPVLTERLWSVFGCRIIYYSFPLYLAYFIPLTFSVLISIHNKWLKFICLINFILLLLCLTWAASRAAWVSVAFSLFLGFLSKRGKMLFTSLSILVFAILLILFSLSSATIKSRLKTTLLPEEWSSRLPLYKSAIAIFADYPLTGIGIGMFEKTLHTPKYELPINYPVPKELNLHAHNTYLEVAAEMGVAGLLTFIGIFLAFFWKASKLIFIPVKDSLKNDQALFLGLVATICAILIFAFSSTIITVGVNNSVYFWIILGMATGLISRIGPELKESI